MVAMDVMGVGVGSWKKEADVRRMRDGTHRIGSS